MVTYTIVTVIYIVNWASISVFRAGFGRYRSVSWKRPTPYNVRPERCQNTGMPKATTSMSGVCSIWHIHHPRGQVTSMGAFIVLVSPNPWQMKFAKCAASPSSLSKMRYSQCAVSPSSLLRDEVYPVCASPSSLLRMRFSQCAVSPSSLAYPVCSEPLIPDTA